MSTEEASPLQEIEGRGYEVRGAQDHTIIPHTTYRIPRTFSDDLGEAEGPCPNCGAPMNAIRGSKHAVCANCGFKDSCCF